MWVADRVDEALEDYREAHGIARPWETRERVVVAITGAPGGDDVIRRAARMAARTRGELLGVHVRSVRRAARTAGRARSASSGALLQELGGEYHELASADPADDAGAVRPGRERDADRARRQPPVAVDAPAPRLGDQQRHPRVGRHRRPRDLVRRSTTTDVRRKRATRPVGARDGVAVSPRRRMLAWIARRRRRRPLLTLVLAQRARHAHAAE